VHEGTRREIGSEPESQYVLGLSARCPSHPEQAWGLSLPEEGNPTEGW
jgi:hypothetical protein